MELNSFRSKSDWTEVLHGQVIQRDYYINHDSTDQINAMLYIQTIWIGMFWNSFVA